MLHPSSRAGSDSSCRRRCPQGKNDAAVAHLETLMTQCREQEGRLFPFMALTLAEFLRKHTGDVGRARKVSSCQEGQLLGMCGRVTGGKDTIWRSSGHRRTTSPLGRCGACLLWEPFGWYVHWGELCRQ